MEERYMKRREVAVIAPELAANCLLFIASS